MELLDSEKMEFNKIKKATMLHRYVRIIIYQNQVSPIL
jgi:hypothetical protein